MNRNAFTLNTTFALLAAAATLSAPAVHAEPAAILAAAGTPTAVTAAGAIAATVAGLSSASLQALPAFPVAAYRDGHGGGTVTLGYTVQADGSVGAVRVLDANPTQVFTRTAVNMVAGWRFVPSVSPQQREVEVRFIAR